MEGLLKKMNIEHRTSNIECEKGEDEEIEKGAECSQLDVCFSFYAGRSMFDVHLSIGNSISQMSYARLEVISLMRA